MNGGILPLSLLCVAVILPLSLTARRAAWCGALAFAAAALIAAFLPLSPVWAELVFRGVIASAMLTAGLVYLPRQPSPRWAVAAGLNGGAWAGALTAIAQTRAQLAIAIPLSLFFVAKRWLPFSKYTIVIKVIASWLIAIAALSLIVSLMPTPGYMPDHME